MAVLAGMLVALFAFTASAQTGPRITSSNDTDFIIGDGGTITVSVTDGVTGATYTFQPVFGFVLTGTLEGGPAIYTHQAGAPTGDFTIRATSPTAPDLEKTLTVGEPGANLHSVNVNLHYTDAAGTARGATPRAATDVDETDTSNVGTNIFITVEALNEGGKPSNVAAAPNNFSVTIFAVGGQVASGDDATGGTASATGASTTTNVLNFAVSKTAASGAGTVRVFVVASIGTATVQSEDLNLTFTVVAGAPAIVSLDDGAPVERNAAAIALDDSDAAIDPAATATRATLPVSATDVDGNDATLAEATAITATVKGPDDKSVTDNGIANVAVTRYVLDTDAETTGNQSAVVVTLPEDTPAGEYTVEATLGTSKDTATFVVTGPPAAISLEADPAGVAEGTTVTVTATVTDSNDVLVANNNTVTFALSNATNSPLVAVGTSHMDVKTKDGVASVMYYAVGSGRAVVTAISGGVTQVIAINTGTAAEDAPAPDPSLASISVEVVGEDHSAGSITVLASLADSDGNAVEGMVSFYHSGDATLFGPKDVLTSDGTATAVYNAKDDFTVLAVSGSHRASLSIEVTSAAEQAAADQAEADRIAQEEADAQAERDRIAAEEAAAEAAAEAEAAAAAAAAAAAEVAAEVERLSGMMGFTSWLSEHTISASELFSALSEDGATAIHLWNGTSWVRYSVVDGNEVPGSVDFTVNLGNVLYISN